MTGDCRPREQLQTDILVVGGGAAGIAAAITAARQGLEVLLVEKYGFCGGGAVAGLSGTICGLYGAAENSQPPPMLVHGFVERFIARMEAKNGLTPPIRYGKTLTRVHDPLIWREVADDLLQEADVRVLFHSLVTEVLTEGGDRVEGAIAWTKQGRVQIRARLTIDASGDADVVAMAGLPFTVGRNGHVQNPTMIFRLLGVDVVRLMHAYGPDTIMPPAVTNAIKEAHSAGDYVLPRTKIFLFPTPRPGELLCNATRVIGADGRELNPLYSRDFTEAEIEGRRQVREVARFLRNHLKGCESSWVNDTGVQVGVRQTRQVTGVQQLTNRDVESGRKRPDGIARSAWPVELHKGDRPQISWLLDDYYEIPYECFVPARGEQLLVAGRCLSAEHEAMASARVTAQCFAYGQAIGHAAALALRQGCAPRAVPGTEIRHALNLDGAGLDD
jgi:hypothetical protein